MWRRHSQQKKKTYNLKVIRDKSGIEEQKIT